MDKKEWLGVVVSLIFICFVFSLFSPLPDGGICFPIPISFGKALWEYRALDVFLQLLIILSGVLGLLTLVSKRGAK